MAGADRRPGRHLSPAPSVLLSPRSLRNYKLGMVGHQVTVLVLLMVLVAGSGAGREDTVMPSLSFTSPASLLRLPAWEGADRLNLSLELRTRQVGYHLNIKF